MYSVSGLDYPSVGPEHAFLREIGASARYRRRTSERSALFKTSRHEGIIPALESSHAVAYAAPRHEMDMGSILVNLSGRGDKDLDYAVIEKYGYGRKVHDERA